MDQVQTDGTETQIQTAEALPPIINCHTHVFTGDHVPPYLAKTFVFWPFYYLINLAAFVRFFRWWNNKIIPLKYKWWYKKLAILKNRVSIILGKTGFLRTVAGAWLTLQVFYILVQWLAGIFPPDGLKIFTWIRQSGEWLREHYLLLPINAVFIRILFVVFVLFFVAWGRNLILFIFRKIWSFLAFLPGKQTAALFRRYLNIGRYAFHKEQKTVFAKLKDQYPEHTGFVVLPMDMEYMDAGPVKKRYRDQIAELAEIKKANPAVFYPFIFADPRRMASATEKEKNIKAGDKPYFTYTHKNGKVSLGDCFMADYLEGPNAFAGIKIYPALGYFPFDEALLPLWKYAADKEIPVLTHCIRGTIFYRGNKKASWNRHPVFQQAKGRKEYEPLLLPEMDNVHFCNHFTHPLNYLCLLDEFLLRKWVGQCNSDTKQLFGYTDNQTPLICNLNKLKICFGHFGGEDEWNRYFELDRDLHSSQLVKKPGYGLDFLFNDKEEELKGKPEQLWKDADWYTIICSLIYQYPNVYADISYILHDTTAVLPLLKQSLMPESGKLAERILYGTDFYVVRNHKSDKQMLADMRKGLTEEEFNQIARYNPVEFLRRLP